MNVTVAAIKNSAKQINAPKIYILTVTAWAEVVLGVVDVGFAVMLANAGVGVDAVPIATAVAVPTWVGVGVVLLAGVTIWVDVVVCADGAGVDVTGVDVTSADATGADTSDLTP
jgi:protein-S-isoprenylcysteine O-methyltransferase Ste14